MLRRVSTAQSLLANVTFVPDNNPMTGNYSALQATGTETGFWDDDGRPAPWPDDIDEWTPATNPPTPEPEEPPF